MKTIKLAGAAALVLGLAGCGTAPAAYHAAAPSTPNAVVSVEAAASACTSSGGTWDGTTCQTPTPMQTDPNGQQCPSLDSLGYCPGDDPSPMQQWCNSTGYSDFEQVESDLNQLSTDAGNQDLASVEQDGTSLFQDAGTAVQHLPPLSNLHKVNYGVWLGYLLTAGYKASQGDISGAASAMEKAAQFISIATYVSNQCGGTS
jgi:hypothetical protein